MMIINFDKGLGPDGFDGHILISKKDVRNKILGELTLMLNNGVFPEYLLPDRPTFIIYIIYFEIQIYKTSVEKTS